jgi:hypothetical protein
LFVSKARHKSMCKNAANPSFNVDAPHIAPRARSAPRVFARMTRRAAARQLTLR